MAFNLWQRAKITSVWSPVGTFDDGEEKLSRQNFDIMRWQHPGATTAVQWVTSPRADAVPVTTSLQQNRLRRGLRDVIDEGLTQDFGWYTNDRLLVNQNFGIKDFADIQFLDLHFFGPI